MGQIEAMLTREELAARLAAAERHLLEVSAQHTRSLEELAASERRYRMLAENATDVVYALDTTGRITWVSPSVEEILGWRPGDLVGRLLHEILHPDDLV
ncbi:MAG: PAS domain-containing protein, partial [Ilumatobacteraceae bacterium]